MRFRSSIADSIAALMLAMLASRAPRAHAQTGEGEKHAAEAEAQEAVNAQANAANANVAQKSLGPLGLEGPERLVLGQDESAVVRYRANDGETIQLSVNVGSLSEPTANGRGEFEAIYTPPQTKFPQVAIVAAINEAESFLA